MSEQQSQFVAIPTEVLESLRGDPRLAYIYMILASYADKQGACWPHQETLAEKADCSLATVKRALSSLKDRGLIEATKRFPESRRQDVQYVILRSPSSSPVTLASSSPVTPCIRELEPVELEPVPMRSRKRDAYWDAFLAELQAPATKSEKGKWASGIKQLKEAELSPEQVVGAIKAWKTKKWPGQPHPMAVATNWSLLTVDSVVVELYPGAHLATPIEDVAGSTIMTDEDRERAQARLRELTDAIRGR